MRKRLAKKAAAAEPFDFDMLPDVPQARRSPSPLRRPKRRVSRLGTRSMRSKSFKAKVDRLIQKAKNELDFAKRSIRAAGKSKAKGIRTRLEGAQDMLFQLNKARLMVAVNARKSLQSKRMARVYRDANEVKRLARNARELAKTIVEKPMSVKSLTRRLNELKKKAESLKKRSQAKQPQDKAAPAGPAKTKPMVIPPSCIQYVIKPECREKMCQGAKKKSKSKSKSKSRSPPRSPPRSSSRSRSRSSSSTRRSGGNVGMRN